MQKLKTVDEQYAADIAELVEKHGCAHFLPANLEPVPRLQAAIQQLAPGTGRRERACLVDLRRLLRKHEQARRAYVERISHQYDENPASLRAFSPNGRP